MESSPTMSVPPDVASVFQGSVGRRRRERLVRSAFLAAALVSVVISALIVLSLVGGAINFVRQIDLGLLLGDGWYPRRGEFDLLTLFAGSLLVTGIALLVAVPVGL